jgi:hypothetical protein
MAGVGQAARAEEEPNMMPYSAYQLYQAERVSSDTERRQADAGLGRMAAAVSQFRANVTRPVRAPRQYRAEHSLGEGGWQRR